jgi:biotin synthase-related radical SAM superfamily protein
MRVLTADSGWPHQVKVGQEMNLYVYWPRALDFIAENGRSPIEWYEKLLANKVIGTDVDTRH